MVATAMAAPAAHGKRLLTRAEAAAYLGLRTQTLAAWATTKRYKLPFVRVGSLTKYRVEDLEKFIAENTVTD